MTDLHNVPEPPANWAAIALGLLRETRRLRLHLQRERLRHRHTREVTRVAIGMLRTHDRELQRSRSTSQSLRDELRRYLAANTEPATLIRTYADVPRRRLQSGQTVQAAPGDRGLRA